MPHLTAAAPAVLHDYYRVLTSGSDAYAEGAALRPLLSAHLDFTGPLAGHRPDSTEGFLRGVAGFIATVQDLTILREVHGDGASAVLYDATMPGGVVRFAEFFTFADGVIDSVALHYAGDDYLAKGGR